MVSFNSLSKERYYMIMYSYITDTKHHGVVTSDWNDNE